MDNKLEKLYKKADKCGFCRKSGNKLQHIHGFGAINPKLMLILINATHRNISSASDYCGCRFPFIGVRQFWKVLADGGLIDKKIAYNLPLRAEWGGEHTKLIQKELLKNKLFLTNIVKCCYGHSAYPDKEVVREQMEILGEEIKIIKPKRIIAFGALVFKTLTGNSIKLADYSVGVDFNKYQENISGLEIPVSSCYFPIGRGNPKKAAKMLAQNIKK